MTDKIADKLGAARRLLGKTDGCAIAYSGGVDSSLVLSIAREVLGDRCIAVIAVSSTYSQRECGEAVKWVQSMGIPYETIVSEELDIPEFSDNPPNRCYYCKMELFCKVREVGLRYGLEHVADGTNADDTKDHRPGMDAARELEVLSPLKEVGLTKKEIRIISREVYGLPMADKPAMACLASRFPYGSNITQQKLEQVSTIEDFLSGHGFKNFRARHHGSVLRLELDTSDFEALVRADLRVECVELAKSLGFTYVTMDLEGFRSGSMNEVLSHSGEAAGSG